MRFNRTVNCCLSILLSVSLAAAGTLPGLSDTRYVYAETVHEENPPNASSEEESPVLPEQEETFTKEKIGLTGEDETLLKTEAETNPISEETEAPPTYGRGGCFDTA